MNSNLEARTDSTQICQNLNAGEKDKYLQPHILKISIVESSGTGETLRLEGHLGGPWVGELRRSCDRILSEGKRLTLDLAAVSFIDRDGVGFLRSLKRADVEFRDCSPFVALQLEADSVE